MKLPIFNSKLSSGFSTGLILSLLTTTNTWATSIEGKWPNHETKKPVNTQTQSPLKKQQLVSQNQNSAIKSTAQSRTMTTTSKKIAAYIGLGVDILPESVVAQMPAEASSGEGILVTRFAYDSPGKKSGLLTHDILLAYDTTNIVHPKQFINLVRKDKPGRVVQLKILRNGKVIIHPVALGLQEVPQIPDGLAIKQLGENYYQATIRFTDANGEKQLRQYKGTREQIYYQALNARDLPEKDRQQILYAAGGPTKNKNTNQWGSFFPFGNNNGGNNKWGSFFPFGNNNGNNNNGRFGSFFPFGQ